MKELNQYIILNESLIRISFFITILLLMSYFEYTIPRKKLLLSKFRRWSNNISIVLINSLLLKLIFASSAISISIYTTKEHIGLLNLIEIPFFFSVVLSIILLDLIIYIQHRLFHEINFFWKFHKVHHSDMDYDVTTGFRFHPIEILISMLIKIVSIFILGVPVFAVVVFEVILSSLALFNHSNIKLPKKLDKNLRYLLVTPDIHRIHHSIYNNELNSNYGFNLSLWDRIFKSYTNKPKDNYKKMTIGLKEFNNKTETVSILSILTLPFKKT